MINEFLCNILSENKIDKDFNDEVKNGYRLPLQDIINQGFEQIKPNYRYGGSLAKGTANINDCDIDLLCYLPSDVNLSVENIYKTIEKSLNKSCYLYQSKNSAIRVYGDNNELWDISVDLVPGKYTSADNKNVYLWCNKTNNKLLSNPEIQINKVKESNIKDVIRFIKFFRNFKNFKFKSFFLEIFAIDIVEQTIIDEDNLYDKLIKFCSHFNEIGITKIYDPANKFGNNIMTIHTDDEFQSIRYYIKELYEVLLTNNENTIKNYFDNKPIYLEKSYKENLKHNPISLYLNPVRPYIILTCNGTDDSEYNSSKIFKKNEHICFNIKFPNSIPIHNVKIIISNSGYEAFHANCLRGTEESTTKITKNHYQRNETTAYNGYHYVQAKGYDNLRRPYYSNIFVVHVCDY